jgi:hypothetical protein
MKTNLSILRSLFSVLLLAAAIAFAGCDKEMDDDAKTKSSDCYIVKFVVNGVTWSISDTSITYTYPPEMEEAPLIPVITLSSGATVTPPSGEAQDFFTEQGVIYTVTAEDGTPTKTYVAKASSNVIASGTIGACTWTITGTTGNYTLIVRGNGTMGDYNPHHNPFNEYNSNIKTIVIQDGVTTIRDSIFGCSSLANVAIGNSVETIGWSAFSGCSSLAEITIPNSVTTIGDGAFSGCTSLTTVTNLRSTPQTIDSYVFYNTKISSGTLKVPAGSVEDYRAASVWRDFGNIESIE